jgi:hypothetical protein
MNLKDALKAVENAGTSISKEKLQEAIRKASLRDFAFAKDATSNFALVKIPL